MLQRHQNLKKKKRRAENAGKCSWDWLLGALCHGKLFFFAKMQMQIVVQYHHYSSIMHLQKNVSL